MAFLFQKQGEVRVALTAGDEMDARLEKLVEAALEADAGDFNTDEPENGVVEVEVRIMIPCGTCFS